MIKKATLDILFVSSGKTNEERLIKSLLTVFFFKKIRFLAGKIRLLEPFRTSFDVTFKVSQKISVTLIDQYNF